MRYRWRVQWQWRLSQVRGGDDLRRGDLHGIDTDARRFVQREQRVRHASEHAVCALRLRHGRVQDQLHGQH